MLTASNLMCGHRNVAVLKEINLDIKKGEIFSLIGLNGSGKTTLLKTLLGLLSPLDGKVLVDDKDVSILNASDRAEFLSMLEADPTVPFAIKVSELFEIKKKSHRLSVVAECIEAFDIAQILHKNMLELSSGQLKRVWLAHLLSLQSKVMIIDEPFSHLDWAQQKRASTAFKTWQARFNTTFVLASHELELVTNLCDRVAVIGNQKIVEAGTPESVLTSKTVCDLFAFKALIDENPIDGSKRITLGKLK